MSVSVEPVQMPALDPRIFLTVARSAETKFPGVLGVTWIDASAGTAKFIPLEQVTRGDLRDGLERMHKEDPHSFLFVNVVDDRVHVFRHAK